MSGLKMPYDQFRDEILHKLENTDFFCPEKKLGKNRKLIDIQRIFKQLKKEFKDTQ